ncbi:Glucomannan 4-beta-mannosyltransferase protein [Dioscorea alata]|uniref:Glucomannan 4-beta-mannosyltransferase protein n=1 Tax=Dioscorea alata TaxID=55571 RepID=A0ACB7U733_DIOAL|nr:Glucomannan 4-beta-mannosyltransferase protein [Dioscorea alata]
MSVMLVIDRVYMSIIIFIVKLLGRKPEKCYKWEPMQEEDEELGSSEFPAVLIQIPMYNEKEVYKLSIGAACGLSWPSDRIIIQVLDDSTDPTIKGTVEKECKRWENKGLNIRYETRIDRKGYKAGALIEGMQRSYVKHSEFVAIFDADFQPQPDFLLRAIPFLLHNPQIALVQARWTFVNSDECLLTRMQEMSLNYHFDFEQEGGSACSAFFGFNGTAGVWRISAIDDAGGWKDRTTVEDMDLAVRATLRGWKFVFLPDLKVKSELPSTLKAFRYQQHRWSCGPTNLFRKMVMDIIRNKNVSPMKKFYVIYNFFLVRKIVCHAINFMVYCMILPATSLVPLVQMPKWATVYIPLTVTFLNAIATPRSFYLVIFWVLFENVMSLHRTKACFIGLWEAKRANEWVVTEKLGQMLKNGNGIRATKKPSISISERLHLHEIWVGAYLLFCGCINVAYGNDHQYIFLFIQAGAFFTVGFGFVGTHVPNS